MTGVQVVQLSAEQRELRAAVRARCEAAADSAVAWADLDDLGVFSLRVPPADGGLGAGMAEAAVVFEELGRALVPGPLIGTAVAAGHLAGVPAAAAAAVPRAGIAEREQRPLLVEYFGELDVLLVLDDAGVWQLDPRELVAEAVEVPVDEATPLWRLPERLPRGTRLGGPALAARWRSEGAVLTAALQVGIAGRVTELAVAYARQRTQFGRPIGSFQAVQHLLAEMKVRAELGSAAMYAAAAALDHPEVAPEIGGVATAVATAKVMADDAAERNARDCIQVHGGMGFTWEAGVHRYLKRAWVLGTCFGTAAEHADALAHQLSAH